MIPFCASPPLRELLSTLRVPTDQFVAGLGGGLVTGTGAVFRFLGSSPFGELLTARLANDHPDRFLLMGAATLLQVVHRTLCRAKFAVFKSTIPHGELFSTSRILAGSKESILARP